MINASEEAMHFLVNTCIKVDNDTKKEMELAVGKEDKRGVHNSEGISIWDARYNRILYNGSLYGFDYAKLYRGGLWTAVGAYYESTGELFLLFKMKNLEKIMKDPLDGHYLSILNSLNGPIEPLQSDFFSDGRLENAILQDYKEKSGELIKKANINPQKVIACGFTEDKFLARIYNEHQQLAEEKDYSYLIKEEFNELILEDNNSSKSFNVNKNELYNKKQRIIGLKKEAKKGE